MIAIRGNEIGGGGGGGGGGCWRVARVVIIGFLDVYLLGLQTAALMVAPMSRSMTWFVMHSAHLPPPHSTSHVSLQQQQQQQQHQQRLTMLQLAPHTSTG